MRERNWMGGIKTRYIHLRHSQTTVLVWSLVAVAGEEQALTQFPDIRKESPVFLPPGPALWSGRIPSFFIKSWKLLPMSRELPSGWVRALSGVPSTKPRELGQLSPSARQRPVPPGLSSESHHDGQRPCHHF